MKRALLSFGAGALIVLSFASAPAEAAKRLKPGQVQLDPALGYVLVRVGPKIGKKEKAPNIYIWRFDPASNRLRTTRKSDPSRVAKGEDVSVFFGDRPFVTTTGESAFLASVTPGDYVIHGTESTCFCLGSYRFSVKAGEVTDIGTVIVAREDGGTGYEELRSHRVASDLLDRPFAVTDIIAVRPAGEGDPIPADLAQAKIVRAELVADVRFPNTGPTRVMYPGGLLVNRAAGLPAPVSGDMKALVDSLRPAGADEGIVAAPVPEKEQPASAEKAAPVAAESGER